MKPTMVVSSLLKKGLGPPSRAYALLNRGLLSIRGPDSAKFLNGIVTNKVDGSDRELEGTYAAFLNAKGRILADVFLHRPFHSDSDEPSYLVECDAAIASKLYSLLKVYKLRSKVKISKLDSDKYKVFALWDETEETSRQYFPLSATNPMLVKAAKTNGLISCVSDNRAPGFALRIVCSGQTESPHGMLHESFLSLGQLPESDPLNYTIRRILYGIPEGSSELVPEKSLPLDSCMDYMGGVDFDKGCYLGQELTIRSHHHGVVRKRVIPVVFSSSSSSKSENENENENSEVEELVFNPLTDINGEDYVGAPILAHSERGSDGVSNPASTTVASASSSPFGPRSGPPSSRGAKLKPSGHVITAVGNVGLALVRLDHFAKPEATFYVEDPGRNVSVKGFVPYWWP